MIPFLKKYLLLISALVIIFAGRLLLLGNGCLEDTDENPFLILLQNFDLLIRLDINAWNQQVLTTWSTYPETAIRLFQAFFLKIYANFLDLPTTSSESLVIMGVFNNIVSILISLIFYKILKRSGFSDIISLTGLLLYSVFLNSNLYIRHILPYDFSLLLHLISVYILIKDDLKYKQILLSGLFLGLGYFSYYGNFMFIIINWILLVLLTKSSLKLHLYKTFLLFIPFFILLVFVETISIISGKSFIKHTIMFSGTIFHGSSGESLIYIFKYFYLVEKWWGVFILGVFFMGIAYLFLFKTLFPKKVKVLIFSGIFAYMTYGLYAFLSGNFVFYGRVLHMYYPFIVLGILVVLQKHTRLIGALSIGAFLNFIFVLKDLNNIGYPRSMIYEFNLFDKSGKFSFESEMDCGITYNYEIPYYDGIEHLWPIIYLEQPKAIESKKDSLVLLNFCFFYHYPDTHYDSFKSFVPASNWELLVERNHFMSHPAYTFEYCTQYGRNFFLEKKFKIKVFKI